MSDETGHPAPTHPHHAAHPHHDVAHPHHAAHPPRRRRTPLHWLRNRSLPILLALSALLLIYPVFDTPGQRTPLAATALFAAVPLFGVCMLATRVWIVLSGILAFGAVISLMWISGGNTEHALGGPTGIVVILFYCFATLAIARSVFLAPSLVDDRVYGGIAVYLMLAIIFAVIDHRIYAADPHAYSFTIQQDSGRTLNWADFLYFSFVCLTTLGFGDIVPVSAHARSIAMFEGAIGMLYPAVLIARLVSRGETRER